MLNDIEVNQVASQKIMQNYAIWNTMELTDYF